MNIRKWKTENQVRVTYSPNKKANGMLSLLSAAVIMADDTKGPMKADVLPT